MSLLVRTLLIWLLVLAVPAQGAAAATMAFCGPSHHGDAVAARAVPTLPAKHAHLHADTQSVHGHHDMAQADAVTTASDSSSAPAKAVHTDKQKCSVCASCCSIGAILNTVLAVPAPNPAPTVFYAVVPAVDALAAGGPDRPPRIVLA